MSVSLSIWTVYDHPRDFPDSWVARRFTLNEPTGEMVINDSLESVRDYLMHMGLVCIPRSPGDDPVIAEVWL